MTTDQKPFASIHLNPDGTSSITLHGRETTRINGDDTFALVGALRRVVRVTMAREKRKQREEGAVETNCAGRLGGLRQSAAATVEEKAR